MFNTAYWHCQVINNRCEDVCGQSEGDSCSMDAGFPSPSPEGLRADASIAGCGHEMAPRPEITLDHRVRRQEPLCLAGGFEPLQLSLLSSSRSMRILGSIVQVPARPMPNIGLSLPKISSGVAQMQRWATLCRDARPLEAARRVRRRIVQIAGGARSRDGISPPATACAEAVRASQAQVTHSRSADLRLAVPAVPVAARSCGHLPARDVGTHAGLDRSPARRQRRGLTSAARPP